MHSKRGSVPRSDEAGMYLFEEADVRLVRMRGHGIDQEYHLCAYALTPIHHAERGQGEKERHLMAQLEEDGVGDLYVTSLRSALTADHLLTQIASHDHKLSVSVRHGGFDELLNPSAGRALITRVRHS